MLRKLTVLPFLAALPVMADRTIALDFAANTTSVHMKINGELDLGPPGGPDPKIVVKDKDGNIVPFQSFGVGGTGIGKPTDPVQSIAWTTAPAAGKYKISLPGAAKNIKNVRVWFDYNHMAPDFTVKAVTFAGLFPVGVGAGPILVFGENAGGETDVTVGPITATFVADLASYYSDTWDEAIGVDFMLGGGTLAAGSDNIPFGSLSNMTGASWVKLTAEMDGQTLSFSQLIIPEPSTLSLMLSGAVALTCLLRRRGHREPVLPIAL